MYEVFYNLQAEPFRLSPDHRFCYEHSGYARARAYMAYAFMRAEGFVMITGRPGTGKTTLIGELVESLSRDNVSTANLVCTQLEADDLLRTVAYNFGVAADGVDKAELLQRISELFHRWHRDGRRALLIVDEAQDLSLSAMEELRLLTNIQKDGQPLLQIFLLGQPELRELVLSSEMEQVHQRIVAASHLEGLEVDEVEAYVMHRLKKVGWQGDPAISRGLFALLHKYSEGVPRRINLICSRLFLHCGVEQRHAIEVDDLRVVIKELQSENLAAGTRLVEEDFEQTGQAEWAATSVVDSEVETAETAPAGTDLPSEEQAPQDASDESVAKATAADDPVREKPRGGVRLRAVTSEPEPAVTPGATPDPGNRPDSGSAKKKDQSEVVRVVPAGAAAPAASVAMAEPAPLDEIDEAAGRPPPAGKPRPPIPHETPRPRSAAVRAAAVRTATAKAQDERGQPLTKAVKPSRRWAGALVLLAALLLAVAWVTEMFSPRAPVQTPGSDSAQINSNASEPALPDAVSPPQSDLPAAAAAAVVPDLAESDTPPVTLAFNTAADSVAPSAVLSSSEAYGDLTGSTGLSEPLGMASAIATPELRELSGEVRAPETPDIPAPVEPQQSVESPAPVALAEVADPSAPTSPANGPAVVPVARDDGLSAGTFAPDTEGTGSGGAPAEPAVVQNDLTLLVRFGVDSSQIGLESEMILDEAARILQRDRGSTAVIKGYADSQAVGRYNAQLSRQRAEAVQDYLARAGLSRAQMSIGDPQGSASDATAAAQASLSDSEPQRIVQIVIRRGAREG